MQAGTFEKKGASARVQRKRAWREEKATRCLISRGVDTVICSAKGLSCCSTTVSVVPLKGISTLHAGEEEEEKWLEEEEGWVEREHLEEVSSK